MVRDAPTVELCGALKNVVALGAGFADGLGYGTNTKSAVMRRGLLEMVRFVGEFHGADEAAADDDGGGGGGGPQLATFFESCGVADLITTCFGGRSRRVAEEFVRSGRGWDELEAEMLGGQKLQGTGTTADVHAVLTHAGATQRYPLFTVIHAIMTRAVPASALVETQLTHEPRVERAHPEHHPLPSPAESAPVLHPPPAPVAGSVAPAAE